MRIIISPAKQMVRDEGAFMPVSQPLLLEKTKVLLETVVTMDQRTLGKLLGCNDKLTAAAYEHFHTMDLERQGSPALFSYQGIQYTYMAPRVFTEAQMTYVQEHLRILSGFYGILRPSDSIHPYRLEMCAPLKLQGHKSLYSFWGSRLADVLTEETSHILNLASEEYAKAVRKHLSSKVTMTEVRFASLVKGKPVEKGVYCKMARGAMVRFLSEQSITDLEQVKAFSELGFQYAPEFSEEKLLVFLRGEEEQKSTHQ